MATGIDYISQPSLPLSGPVTKFHSGLELQMFLKKGTWAVLSPFFFSAGWNVDLMAAWTAIFHHEMKNALETGESIRDKRGAWCYGAPHMEWTVSKLTVALWEMLFHYFLIWLHLMRSLQSFLRLSSFSVKVSLSLLLRFLLLHIYNLIMMHIGVIFFYLSVFKSIKFLDM